VSNYSREEYAADECNPCHPVSSQTSAAVLLYDSVDAYNKRSAQHFHKAHIKCCYAVIIVVVLVKSASDVSLCGLAESVRQLADCLREKVIANGVVVNVSRVRFVQELRKWCRLRTLLYVQVLRSGH